MNSDIQIALIGAGGMGSGDAQMASSIAGVKLLAVADVYDGRRERARERWGDHIFTTRDYREILARPEIDAVIIATPDHWHKQITVDALAAGKHVYCEKPMVHSIDEGAEVIAAQKKSGKLLQIGSQYVSSLVYQKAKELISQGAIGQINMVEAWLDRNTAIGAWQYSIPPGVTPQNLDWPRFLGTAPKRPFEPIRAFRWRNYSDYGTGVAGDLFVHLLSGLHYSTGAIGPTRVYATGGLRFWKDGRDAPDVMLALLDYPETPTHPAFTVSLKVNFESGLKDESFGVKFVGSEGTMVTGYNSLVLSRQPQQVEEDYSIASLAKATQQQLREQSRRDRPANIPQARQETYTPPRGFNAHQEHHESFYRSIRENRPSVEDAEFGFRAAGPALLTNVSYFEEKLCGWDPVAMRVVSSLSA